MEPVSCWSDFEGGPLSIDQLARDLGPCSAHGPRVALLRAATLARRRHRHRRRRHKTRTGTHTSTTTPNQKPQPLNLSYDDNGGTTLAVAGADYCIVAASTRMSTGYSILTRDASKLLMLTDKAVLASAGCQVDMKGLQKVLHARNVMFQHQHGKPMSVVAAAQLLSNTLYNKRFFPYFTFNIAAGLDDEGRGAVFTYDAIGSYERTGYSCQGSGKDLMQPVLDNQLKAASPLLVPAANSTTELPLEQAVDLVKDAFVSAGERDIYTVCCFVSVLLVVVLCVCCTETALARLRSHKPNKHLNNHNQQQKQNKNNTQNQGRRRRDRHHHQGGRAARDARAQEGLKRAEIKEGGGGGGQ